MDVSQATGYSSDGLQSPNRVGDALADVAVLREPVQDLLKVFPAELEGDVEVLDRFEVVRGFEYRIQNYPFFANSGRI